MHHTYSNTSSCLELKLTHQLLNGDNECLLIMILNIDYLFEKEKKKLNQKDEEKIILWVKRRRLAKEIVKIRHVMEKAKSFHVDLKPYDG